MNKEVKALIDKMEKKGFNIHLVKKEIKQMEVSPDSKAYIIYYTMEFVPPDKANKVYRNNS